MSGHFGSDKTILRSCSLLSLRPIDYRIRLDINLCYVVTKHALKTYRLFLANQGAHDRNFLIRFNNEFFFRRR